MTALALSTSITTVHRGLPPTAPYRFYFVFIKLGQQLTLPHPHLFTDIISNFSRVDISCIHIATTFTHTSPNFSTFWNLLSTTSLYTGQDVKKYPFFGLAQLGNVTVKTPTNSASFLTAWHPTSQQCSNITYVQFYSPLTKSFSSKPFEDHPFLLTLMLGREYVSSSSTFRKVWLAAERDGDFTALREAIRLHLDPASARCEVVITGSDLGKLLRVDLPRLAENIKSAGLIVQVSNSRMKELNIMYVLFQVPRNDMLQFALAIVQQLYDPLVMALASGVRNAMGTVLLCETLLSLLTSMSTKDMPYRLLRAYDITPIQSGVITRERRLCLSRHAREVGGVLCIPNAVIHRVFVPLRKLPAEGRRQVTRMLDLLEEIHTGDGNSVAEKCAFCLFKALLAELLESHLIPGRAVLKSSSQLVKEGCGIYSVTTAAKFVAQTFQVATLPQESRICGFLKTALDLCGDQLMPALEHRVLDELSFVPHMSIHDGRLNISATSFSVLSRFSLAEVKSQDMALWPRKIALLY